MLKSVREGAGQSLTIFYGRNEEEYRKELEGFDMDFIEEKDIPSLNADIAISLGGDGSMLDVSEKTAASACPVLGINLGNLGFLTALEKSEFSMFSSI